MVKACDGGDGTGMILTLALWSVSSGRLGLLITNHDLLPRFTTICSKFSLPQKTVGSSKVGRVNRMI